MAISPAEPVTALRHVKIVECGEPLVDFLALCPELRLDRPRFAYRRETLLRKSVAEMICQANKLTPPGYNLAIIEGWRAPHIQRRMYAAVWKRFQETHPDWSETRLKRTVNRFTAPMDLRVPPPHSTGGALDVFLVDDDGKSLDMQSPFEPMDHACFPFDAQGLSDTARKHRQILHDALAPTGLTNYPSEYWHWSYGDQGWAYRGGHPNALYGAIEPAEWRPAPEDDVAEPLVFLLRET